MPSSKVKNVVPFRSAYWQLPFPDFRQTSRRPGCEIVKIQLFDIATKVRVRVIDYVKKLAKYN